MSVSLAYYLNVTAHDKTSLLFAYTERRIIMAMYFTQAQALLGADVRTRV